MEYKKRKILARDWDSVEKTIKEEYEKRKDAKYRKDAEKRWKEVDRQLCMDEMVRLDHSGKALKWTWQNAMELGELAKAHEVITADVMRIMFPADRHWFRPHVEMRKQIGQDGKAKSDPTRQAVGDGLLRNLMVQQHKDFGFKDRFRLSVKEALSHGGFVAQAVWHSEMMVKDQGEIRTVAAPIWKPYSMWNAYPDPTMAVIGGELFYPGSMIVADYMRWARFKNYATGDNWMPDRVEKVEKDHFEKKKSELDDVEILTYEGDIYIDRKDGEGIHIPNACVKLANGKIVYYKQNPLPFSSFIYGGYERQDVRNPLYTSPIIKNSPLQKAATIVMNKFLDWVALQVEPPVEYDGSDPDYVASDGPIIAPGAKNPRKGGGKAFEALKIGSGQEAIVALQMFFKQFQEGLGVSSTRAGGESPDRQTATEASLASQGAEVRTMEFIDQLQGKLLPFLYIQHQLNRDNLEQYTFYNDELHTPDFIRVGKDDIQADAIFEVTGAKGILGERERAQRTAQVVAFLASNPLFASKLIPEKIAIDMLADAGKKNPEEWLQLGDPIPPQVKAQMQEMQQMLQQLQQENAQLKGQGQVKIMSKQLDLQKATQTNQTKIATATIQANAQAQGTRETLQTNRDIAGINALVALNKTGAKDAAT